jgi:cell division ATPase FtsA
MLKNSIIAVGMDIGTTHIRVIIGEFNKDGTINIVLK